MAWELWSVDEHGDDHLVQTFDDHLVAEVVRDEWLGSGRHRCLWLVEAAGDDTDDLGLGG